MAKSFDAAVIGTGVFGAWTAWHLQRAGQRVLLVDPYGPASARASSGGETRVIRMGYGPDSVYTRMSWRSLAKWKDFFARIARPELFRQTGVLWMAMATDAAAKQSLATLREYEIPHEALDAAALARRWPQIAVPQGGWAIFEPESGGLLARRAVQALVADCIAAGAELRIDRVLTLDTDASRHGGSLEELRTASGDAIRAESFVFACGPWLGRVLPDVLGGRIFPTRQEVFYFGVPAGEARFASPALPVWLDFGRDWYGFPDLDGRGFKLAHDTHGEAIDPDTAERVPSPARIAAAREFLALRFPELAGAPLVGSEVCQYENSSNGDFVIDRHPAFDNVWIAGGGSGHGFKHGPAVGEYLAARMFGDGPVELRFALATKKTEQSREVH
jgi:monomeric sarcosine oxidase